MINLIPAMRIILFNCFNCGGTRYYCTSFKIPERVEIALDSEGTRRAIFGPSGGNAGVVAAS